MGKILWVNYTSAAQTRSIRCRGSQACNFCMQKPDTDLAEEVAFEAEWAEAAVHPGPHCLIQQPDMRLFWWRTFGSQEEVTWDVFWSRFPKDLSRQGDSSTFAIVP